MHNIATFTRTHGLALETRTSHNLLGASSDKEALSLFLRRFSRRSDETLRRYTRELVRFTAFIRKELIKGYADIRVADVETYVHFMQAPWPHWQQPGIDHNNPQKVYFPNPVKPGKSTDQIITVLSSFFSYLHTTGYLQGNPVSGFDKTGEKFARGHGEPRYFFEDEWQVLLDSLVSYPEKTKRQQREKARLHYVIAITYGAALRQSELARHTCRNIRTDQQGNLTIEIHGKGRRLRTLPVKRAHASGDSSISPFSWDIRFFQRWLPLGATALPRHTRRRKLPVHDTAPDPEMVQPVHGILRPSY